MNFVVYVKVIKACHCHHYDYDYDDYYHYNYNLFNNKETCD